MDPKPAPAPVTPQKTGGRTEAPKAPPETRPGGMAGEGGLPERPAEDARDGGMIGEG